MNIQSSLSRAPFDSSDPLAARLQHVDWAFSNRATAGPLESLHPYPAKFIPDIPGTLLDAMNLADGSWVFDPFVGSGTTLVESQRRGLPSIGIDLNPIATLISRVKTSPAPSNLLRAALDAIERSSSIEPELPKIPNLDHWFRPHVQQEVARLLSGIDCAEQDTQDCLKLALSSVLVRVSNQDSDTRYAAVDKRIAVGDVERHFLRSLEAIERALASRGAPTAIALVLEQDTLRADLSNFRGRVGALITSPPYPNAYEYWLYHKYRMWWLGHNPLAVKEAEIGARAHFFKANRHTREDFVRQMSQVMSLAESVLVRGGYAAFVVGRSIIHGEVVDNAQIIETAAAQFGFRRVYRVERVIAPHRKSFNLSHANIKTETILVLRKPE